VGRTCTRTMCNQALGRLTTERAVAVVLTQGAYSIPTSFAPKILTWPSTAHRPHQQAPPHTLLPPQHTRPSTPVQMQTTPFISHRCQATRKIPLPRLPATTSRDTATSTRLWTARRTPQKSPKLSCTVSTTASNFAHRLTSGRMTVTVQWRCTMLKGVGPGTVW
jgi:hypothetical protein